MRSVVSRSWMLVLLALACGEPKVVGGGSSGPGGSGAGGDPGTSRPTSPPVFNPPLPPAVTDAAPPPGPGDTCAEDIQKAQQVQVDVLLLVDSSSSMSDTPPGSTLNRYSTVKGAILAFARDPGSAGLGLGLQFFPNPGDGSPCQIGPTAGGPS